MLCYKTEGLTASQAIRSYVLACNEQGAISVPNDEQVLNVEQLLNDESEAKLTRYMASPGIKKMT